MRVKKGDEMLLRIEDDELKIVFTKDKNKKPTTYPISFNDKTEFYTERSGMYKLSIFDENHILIYEIIKQFDENELQKVARE